MAGAPHDVGLKHRSGLLLHDIEIDLIRQARPRVFSHGDYTLTVSGSRHESTEEIASDVLLRLCDRGLSHRLGTGEDCEPTLWEPIARTTGIDGVGYQIGFYPRGRSVQQHLQPARRWNKL